MLNRLLAFLVLICFVVGGYVAYTAVTLPNVKRALETGIEPSQTSQILASDRSVIMSYGKYQHKPMTLDQMPQALIDALLSTEDRRFFQHKGIDPIGTGRALFRDIARRGAHEGGSTITQQLARNIFLSHERSVQRKIREALLAIKLEQQLTKEQILELYLNNVYFGEGAYGIGAASNIYFGKNPSKLTKAECALLAGLPQAPSLYSPFANPELAKKRRNTVIQNMLSQGKIDENEANIMLHAPLRLNPQGRLLSSADKVPFFNRYVIQDAMNITETDEQSFWQQGMRVYTTLDTRAQTIAEHQVVSLNNAFGRTGAKQQAALLSVDSKGRIMAYVGGKNFSVSQFDRVSQAHRAAGSLFKIFVYTTAIERGISPLTVYKDAEISFGDWKPLNYDKRYHGFMTLAQALAQSNNIIAVKLINELTPEAVIQMAQKMGIHASMQPNLALALGAVDVNLLEMTGAFSTFSNNGVFIPPYAIEKIVDRDGRVIYQHQPEQHVVLQRAVRDTMVAMMQGVIRYGTAKGAAFGRDAAGKTGTSDDYRDAWFIGYTPEMTTGVWVGNDDNSQMPGITGGSLPARIWRAYMSRVLGRLPKQSFDLAYAAPIEEKDFFVYNLANLSTSEGKAAEEGGEVTEDVESELPENPEGGVEQRLDENGQPVLDNTEAPQVPEVIDINTNRPNSTPTNVPGPEPATPVRPPSAQTPTTGPGRFTTPAAQSSPPPRTLSPVGPADRPARFGAEATTGTGRASAFSRPIVEPVSSGPRSIPKPPPRDTQVE